MSESISAQLPSMPSVAPVQSRNGNKLELIRTTTNPTAIIPRQYRRGILGTIPIVLIPEIQNPYEYTRPVKHMITAIVGLAGAAAPMGSSVVFPALPLITRDFNSTSTVANLTVALYMGSMAICPIYWSQFSERSGRRTVYICSFLAFTIFNLGAALAPTSQMWFLILMRIGSGGSAGAVQSVGAGTIADIWEVRERGRAMGWFYLGPLMGPLVAPLIGGGVTSKWGWRGTQWFICFFGAAVYLALITALPETLRRKPVTTEKDKEIESESERTSQDAPGDIKNSTTATTGNPDKKEAVNTSGKTLKRVKGLGAYLLMIFDKIIGPFKTIKYLRYPPVLLTILYGTMAFMCLYILNVSIQATFSSPPYSFSPGMVGLFYVAPAIGNFAGSILGGRWTDKIMKRQARVRQRKGKGNGELIPEDRMYENVLTGGLLFPIALFWYGWTVGRIDAWIVPVLATFFFGFGSLLIFGVCTTMLTEFVPGKSSSAVALQNLIRNLFACIGGVVTAPLLDAVGEGILFSICGGMGLCCLIIPWTMKRYGPKWRERVVEYDLT